MLLWYLLSTLISIHAPVWGATRGSTNRHGVPRSFQSTHPCGVRRSHLPGFLALRAFQSTHPCGVRLRRWLLVHPNWYFNPRTRVGCDSSTTSALASMIPFQSTHPCGVRRGVIARFVASLVLAQFQISHCCYRKSIIGPHF